MNNSQRKEFMSSLIICKDFYSFFFLLWTVVCSTEGQSFQLVESIRRDEWDQAGAEAALLLHTQPAISSHAVTQLTEGKAQQPSSRPHMLFTLLKYPFQLSLNGLLLYVSRFYTFVKTKAHVPKTFETTVTISTDSHVVNHKLWPQIYRSI